MSPIEKPMTYIQRLLCKPQIPVNNNEVSHNSNKTVKCLAKQTLEKKVFENNQKSWKVLSAN